MHRLNLIIIQKSIIFCVKFNIITWYLGCDINISIFLTCYFFIVKIKIMQEKIIKSNWSLEEERRTVKNKSWNWLGRKDRDNLGFQETLSFIFHTFFSHPFQFGVVCHENSLPIKCSRRCPLFLIKPDF